jgi:hypothetical protein
LLIASPLKIVVSPIPGIEIFISFTFINDGAGEEPVKTEYMENIEKNMSIKPIASKTYSTIEYAISNGLYFLSISFEKLFSLFKNVRNILISRLKLILIKFKFF